MRISLSTHEIYTGTRFTSKQAAAEHCKEESRWRSRVTSLADSEVGTSEGRQGVVKFVFFLHPPSRQTSTFHGGAWVNGGQEDAVVD